MRLELGKVSASPDILEPAGGAVHVELAASVDSGRGELTATYTIPTRFPYVFAHPPDPRKRREQRLAAQRVSAVSRQYGKDLELVREAGGGPVELVCLDLSVQLTSGGTAVTDGTCLTVGPGRTLGAALKAHRDAADVSQMELADAVGLSRSTVSRAERGHGVSEATLARIAGWVREES